MESSARRISRADRQGHSRPPARKTTAARSSPPAACSSSAPPPTKPFAPSTKRPAESSGKPSCPSAATPRQAPTWSMASNTSSFPPAAENPAAPPAAASSPSRCRRLNRFWQFILANKSELISSREMGDRSGQVRNSSLVTSADILTGFSSAAVCRTPPRAHRLGRSDPKPLCRLAGSARRPTALCRGPRRCLRRGTQTCPGPCG